MQSAATIRDAVRRLDEAGAIFRFKSRAAAEEFDEVAARWVDERAQQFVVRYIHPQNEWMEQGARLCHFQAELVNAAHSAAENAERELQMFFAAKSESESAAAAGLSTAQSARDMAAKASTDSSRAATEIQSIQSGISAASLDPGW